VHIVVRTHTFRDDETTVRFQTAAPLEAHTPVPITTMVVSTNERYATRENTIGPGKAISLVSNVRRDIVPTRTFSKTTHHLGSHKTVGLEESIDSSFIEVFAVEDYPEINPYTNHDRIDHSHRASGR